MAVDYIVNDQGHGSVAHTLIENDMDVNTLRPWQDPVTKKKYVVKLINGKPEVCITNAPTTLRKDDWKRLDDAVVKAVVTAPTRLWGDLRGAGLITNIGNGMGKTILEYERMSDIGPATISMDGIRQGDNDRPVFDLAGLPLPIIHKDFFYTARQIAVSRNSDTPLDTTMAELSARKCMEEVEKYLAGSQTFNYGGYNIYGYTNYPNRLTQSITAPSSANHATTISEVLAMKKKLTDKGFYGPYALYASPAWDLYLDEDYSTTKGENTLRQRILAVEGVNSIRTSYFLTGNALLLVQLTPDVVRGVVGMNVTTLQWPTDGGMRMNFKVMCIMVPQFRADFNNSSGIVHGS